MDIWMIWIMYRDGHLELRDAWDDDTLADNHRGWQEALDAALRDAKADKGRVRVVRTTVDLGGVTAAFDAPVVANGGVEAEEPPA